MLVLYFVVLLLLVFNFRSILEGGFSAAAQYLNRTDTPLTLNSLVDVKNKAALESMLGIVGAPAAKVITMLLS